MREIKFRAWDKKFKIMINPTDSFADYIGFDGSVHEIGEYNNYSGGGKTDEDVTEQYELMQFIGLHDKNGREIYEMDIANYRGDLGIIKYHKSWASFYFSKAIGKNEDGEMVRLTSSVPMWNEWSILEIIGNIYQNADLLELKLTLQSTESAQADK